MPDGTSYYQNLANNNNPDWTHIHVHANYGKSLGGQAVFRASFNPGFHIKKAEELKIVQQMPIMIGQDFGRTPACLIGQIDNRGRLVIYDELVSEDMGIEQFATVLLRPKLMESYMGMKIFMVADPKGRDKSQTNEDSPFDVLKRLGFDVYAAPTNNIDPRIRAVEQLLLHQVDGGPQLIISDRCGHTTQAMKYWYRYRRKQTGILEDKPEKTHPWSDVADCLQYMAMSTNANYLGKVMASMNPRPPRKPTPTGAWT